MENLGYLTNISPTGAIPEMEESNRCSCAEDEPKFSLYKSMEFL